MRLRKGWMVKMDGEDGWRRWMDEEEEWMKERMD